MTNPTSPNSSINPLSLLLLCGVVLLAFALRVHTLGVKELSADEAFGVVLIRQPFADIIRPGQDLHPPLYHLAQAVMARVGGESPFALRFTALIFGVLSVGVAMAVGRRVAGWRAGALGGVLLALSPLNVYWAQDARLYTLLVLTTLLSTWAFLRLSQPRRHGPVLWRGTTFLRGMALYLPLTLAAMYTQYGAFWVIGAHNLLVIVGWAWPRLRKTPAATLWGDTRALLLWFGGQAALALIYLPWVLAQWSFLAAPQNVRGPDAGFVLARSLDAWSVMLNAWLIGFVPTHSADSGTALALGAGVLLAVGGLWAVARRAGGWTAAAVGAWLLLTPLLISLQAQVIDYFNPRFAIAATAPLAVLWGAAVTASATVRGRRVSLIARAGVALLLLPLVAEAWRANAHWWALPSSAKGDYGAVMAQIAARARVGDVLWFSNDAQGALVAYYAPSALPYTILDKYRLYTPDQTLPYLQSLRTDDVRRVWLVEFGDPIGFDSLRLVPNWLTENGFREYAFDYSSGKVALYNLSAAQATEWQPLDAQFGADIRLIAYKAQVQGDTVLLSLRWQALNAPTADYHVGNYLLDADGFLVSQTDAQPRGGAARTNTWAAGQIIEDQYAIPIPTGTASGTYQIAVALYTFPELLRAPVSGPDARTHEDARAAWLTLP
jgi:mannosyltransferase